MEVRMAEIALFGIEREARIEALGVGLLLP